MAVAGRGVYPLIGERIMKRIAELKENFAKGLIHNEAGDSLPSQEGTPPFGVTT